MIRVETRVINLEKMMSQLIQTVEQTSREMREFKDEIRADTRKFKDEIRADTRKFKDEIRADTRKFKDEMREFKDEMRADTRKFKDEMREFKDEMREFKDEMREFKDEMREFKDEMREFKDESRRMQREMNKKWGELSNKMGTMAEDLVAPSVPHILAQTVGCERLEIDSAVRVKRRYQGKRREFDVVASCGDYLFINETKSNLDAKDIKVFAQEILPTVRDFFPEYAAKKVIGAIASLYVDESLVRYGEKSGVIVLGFGEDVMEVLNSADFKPKIW